VLFWRLYSAVSTTPPHGSLRRTSNASTRLERRIEIWCALAPHHGHGGIAGLSPTCRSMKELLPRTVNNTSVSTALV
jgi:hypothetical protein